MTTKGRLLGHSGGMHSTQLYTVHELVQAVLVHHKIQLYLGNKLYIVGCDLRLMSIVLKKTPAFETALSVSFSESTADSRHFRQIR